MTESDNHPDEPSHDELVDTLAAFPDSRRGAADSQGAPGTVRHGAGGAGGGAERTPPRSTA